METISRRSALATLGHLSLAPALLSIGSPLLKREPGSGDDSPREVTATLYRCNDAFLYWKFSPGSDRIFAELAALSWPNWRTEVPAYQASDYCSPRLRKNCWPQWIERAKTEEMFWYYDSLNTNLHFALGGSLTPKRLWDLADSVGVPLTIFVTREAADSGLMFQK